MKAINKLENDFNDIENIISDCDHVVRRLYRCFINGDYGKEHAFNYAPEFDVDGFKSNRSLRSFVIRSFCTNQALDYGLNYGQVQRWLVENIGHENLERLNEELMIDVSDLIHEYNA